ncbi:GPI ethanolamine phosphate transferase 1-like isoform X2 [Musa acuminata AAA Group]|uniref:GPI ethanolamine phosphate transferase 1-like isoform X2 n=1 Tax=Musa acuminata AAA Group TaxID=214697 RepID=UPI0031D84233
MAGGGILGGGRSSWGYGHPAAARQIGGRWWQQEVKRRERWLVGLGIVLHAVYMLSIFDIYFKTPIVHGMDPVPQRFSPPAKRLVLLVADGLRADKFFEPDSDGRFRAPFLRSVIKEKGRWGISHARPPTESRPGHVSIIAGFYEDPSAVTKGWKANPVEFDSVFNRSRHTFAFGSPDIIPIFCRSVPHSTWATYPHEYEDFASDASFLDQWSFDQFHSLLNRSRNDPKLRQLLLQDKLVIFLHLLGCDTNGHAHRPYSSIYLSNVKVVDKIAEDVYNLLENYFNDNQTAYIFTADHGMSDKGSHGDGHPSNTDTPLVAWGAGIKNPGWLISDSLSDDGFRFVDEHKHDMPTPTEWGLRGIERVDVNQADLAPLMATIVGLPCPVNSVGNLPLGYLSLNKVYLGGCLLMSLLSVILYLENSPLLYHAYISVTVFLWTQILSKLQLLNAIWKELSARNFILNMKLLSVLVMSFIILEFLVASFFNRKLYTWFFLMAGILAALHLFFIASGRHIMALYLWSSCWFLSIFTLMPAEVPDKNPLVVASGGLIVLIGMASRWIQSSSRGDNFKLYIVQMSEQRSQFHKLFLVQASLVVVSSLMVWLSTSHRALKKELLPMHQLINWSIAVVSMILPLFSPPSILSRLTSIFLGFAPPFLLLSIGYEAVFYSALALVLMGWILLECVNLYSAECQGPLHVRNLEDNPTDGGYNARYLQLSDIRIPLVFMVLFNIAFFGTGNFASIASFEISSVYRFITIFSPFLMAALLIFKLFIPFLLVICVFSAISKLIRVPRLGCYFIVIIFSDLMTIHFFFLVRNTGSWMEIGNSISHFGLMSAQVVFVLLLLALTSIYTKDIEVPSQKLSWGKAT